MTIEEAFISLKELIIEVNKRTIDVLRGEIQEMGREIRGEMNALHDQSMDQTKLLAEAVEIRFTSIDKRLENLESGVERLQNQSINLYVTKQDKVITE